MMVMTEYLSFYYHWVDIAASGQLVPEGIIGPVVSASALAWFIRYIFYRNLQFLNHVIIIKIKVFLPLGKPKGLVDRIGKID
jgi:hypothetical protein